MAHVVGEVDELIKAAFGAQGLAHDAHGTIDGDGTSVGEFDRLTQSAFGPQGLAQGLHMTYMAQYTTAKQLCWKVHVLAADMECL